MRKRLDLAPLWSFNRKSMRYDRMAPSFDTLTTPICSKIGIELPHTTFAVVLHFRALTENFELFRLPYITYCWGLYRGHRAGPRLRVNKWLGLSFQNKRLLRISSAKSYFPSRYPDISRPRPTIVFVQTARVSVLVTTSNIQHWYHMIDEIMGI